MGFRAPRGWFVILATGAMLVASAKGARAAPPPTIAEPGAPSDVRYVVSLTPDRAGLVWRGTARVSFRNAGPAPLPGIWVRLWANGVTGCSSAALRVTVVRGASARESELGCTALRLRLVRPLGAGERTTVVLRMSLRVPRMRYRFGIVRGVKLFSNALPILAFKGPDGWHLDRFSRVGESFVSGLADWSLRLEIPSGMDVVGAGRRRARRIGEGRTSVSFTLPRARELAWAAGRLSKVDARVGSTRVSVSAPRATPRGTRRAVVAHVQRHLPRLAAMFGPYVYRQLAVVVVPGVGMEHSGLIMTPADGYVVAHELAHQWWYASVGSDQARAPWLDEAFAQWAGMSAALPRGRGVAPRGGDCLGARGDEPLVTRGMAFWAGQGDRYAGAVYFAGACLLDQLEAYLGRPAFQAALRAYAERHRMGWHTEADFKAAMDAAAGDDRLAPVWQRFGIDGVSDRRALTGATRQTFLNRGARAR